AGLTGRDAALATELGYGTLRVTGTLDEVLRRCASRDLDDIEVGVLNLLRLGAYQLLRTRIPTHAAVATTVDLARATGHGRAAGEAAERPDELPAALAADDERPETHLVGWPGRISQAELAAEAGGQPGPYSPYAVRLGSGGEPGALAAVRQHRAGVQDEGSQ